MYDIKLLKIGTNR